MTINAGASAADRVAMVGNSVIGFGLVALGAYAIPLSDELITVRVMTVATNNARLGHFTLHE